MKYLQYSTEKESMDFLLRLCTDNKKILVIGSQYLYIPNLDILFSIRSNVYVFESEDTSASVKEYAAGYDIIVVYKNKLSKSEKNFLEQLSECQEIYYIVPK